MNRVWLIGCTIMVMLSGCGGGSSSGGNDTGMTIAVSSLSPADGATGVAVDTTLVATLSQEIDCPLLPSDALLLADSTQNVVSGSINCSGTTLSFTPSNSLNYSSIYSATLKAGISGTSGATLASETFWSFTTTTETSPLPQPSDMPVARQNHSAVLHNGYLYVAGGENGSSILSSIDRYEIATDTWISSYSGLLLDDNPYKVKDHAVTMHGDKMYILGGYMSLINGYSGPADYTMIYDTVTDLNERTDAADVNMSRHCAATLGGDVYAFLGNANRKLDTSTLTWSEVPTTPFNGTAYSSCAKVDDSSVYVYSGNIGLFNATTGTWTETILPPEERIFAEIAYYNGKIAVIGGKDANQNYLDTILIYETSTSMWSTSPQTLSIKRTGHNLVNDNGSVYVIGGTNGNQTLNSVERIDNLF